LIPNLKFQISDGDGMNIFRGIKYAIVPALAALVILAICNARAVRAGQDGKNSGAPAGNATRGKQIFYDHGCYECHGREGQGSLVTGPRLGPDPIPYESFTSYIRKPTGEMPPFTSKVVPDQDLADIYAYLASRPHPPAPKTPPAK
jgi:mono/diheme cytochrome c family protein